MQLDGRSSRRLDAVLDALASKLGIFMVVGLLVGVCVGAAIYLNSVMTQLEENHTIFRERQIRNGYVALSDIQRLILITQSADKKGEMTPDLAADFLDAADIMYVRTDNFDRIMKREQTRIPSGGASIAALTEVVEIADKALANDFSDIGGLLADLLAANAKARQHLVQFLDDMRRLGETVLENQSRAVRKQQFVVLANLAGLALIGSVALMFLRREVLARRARERAEDKVNFLAYFDSLTELPNRTQFQERLSELLQARQPLALLYLDLDDFKLINDTHGHAAGDAVLCHVSRILGKTASEWGGFASRLGGDEFALVVPSDNIASLTALCRGIIADTAEPYWFDGELFVVGVSVGIATSTQVQNNGPTTIDMLSRVTDFALYTSKATGRKCFTVYDHGIEKRFLERRSLIDELPKAIKNGDLEVHLQPKVTLPKTDVHGFEALVRWRRDGQLVPPGDFIDIAEESGLVVDIDHYMLRKSTKLIADWNKAHGTEFSVSVNLSALHFTSPRIGIWVEQALWDAGLPSSLLTLEVTETTEMSDWKQAREILDDLKTTGCRIAIDDFGTGFSSLEYLRTMKAQELKIDRSLVRELEDSRDARLLLSSVMEIAQNLKLDVTIEGVETERQAEIVHNLGARCAQGFLFGRPLPPAQALGAAMTVNAKLSRRQAS